MDHAQGRAALEDWAQRIIRAQIEQAGEALAAHCQKPRSTKRLHAARKQLARLRAALDDLALLAGVASDFRERVHELYKCAGKVRDADVFLDRIGGYCEDAFGQERSQLKIVEKALRKRRKKTRRKLEGAIAGTASELRP